MRLYLLAALAAVLCCFPARADWVQDGSAWVFVADVDDKPAAKDCGCDKCDCPLGACPNCTSKSATVPIAAPARGHYVQQCDGRTCRWVWVADDESVPAVAVSAPVASAAPVTSYAAVEGRRPVRRLFGLVFRPFRAIRGGGCAACGN